MPVTEATTTPVPDSIAAIAAQIAMLKTRNAELTAMLERIVRATQDDYDAGWRAASFHNNSDACKGGNYMSDPPLPAWFAAAKSLLDGHKD